MTASETLAALSLTGDDLTGGTLEARSPIDGAVLGIVRETDVSEMGAVIARSQVAFAAWRSVPAPRRGELIRLFGEELRAAKTELGALVTLEVGKIASEGEGEVQEMIDICDLAVGQSRQLHGLTIASERPGHRMMETWHPMGPCGVITAFNFPVAVLAWNATLALVCGNPIIWKPSEIAPLTAMATTNIMQRALERFGDAPDGLFQLVVGGPDVAEAFVQSADVPIVSATGSTRMGRSVGPAVLGRWGRPILELGGNNAMIVAPSADRDMAVRAIVFSAVGTAGQRCTSLRRLIVHESIRDDLVDRLRAAYASLQVGDPRQPETLVGPLIDHGALDAMQGQLDRARAEGGTVHHGEIVSTGVPAGGAYVRPALAVMPTQTESVRAETFAPILSVLTYDTLDEAIALQNDVPQGLSSCIFTLDVREAETFLSSAGSDCGIANVNLGPSGAEIGGAFGGEKETGGGRESGSDAWKGYMRRQTATINYSAELPWPKECASTYGDDGGGVAVDQMRKPLFVVAFVFLTAVIGLELGASVLVQPAGVTTAALRASLLENDVDSDDIDDAMDDLASRENDDPPGLAIPAMAMLDGMLWLAMAAILAALFVPANVLGRVVAPINLLVSILIILGGIVAILFTIVLVFLMIGLFLAPPFGTIAYLARWGAFPRGDAQATMAMLLLLKLAFCGFALASSLRFLQQKALVVLVVLSFVVQFVVGLLQNFPPLPLVSITDAIAAIIAVLVAVVWAIWVLIGSLIGTIRIVRVKRT